jgi:DNA repair exonuclease SbcCD ATPase subunit
VPVSASSPATPPAERPATVVPAQSASQGGPLQGNLPQGLQEQLSRIEDKTARIEDKYARSEALIARMEDKVEAASQRMNEAAKQADLAALRSEVRALSDRTRRLPGAGALLVMAIVTAVLTAAVLLAAQRFGIPGLTR